MTTDPPLFLPVQLGGHAYLRLNLDHPDPLGRVWEEVASGVPVYYDRVWSLTDRFAAFLHEHAALVAGKDVLVVGAGVGMEAVVVGSLCRSLRVNDMAPVSLELLERQLRENGVEPAATLPGSFAEVALAPELDLVVACFVVYDRGTARAMERLLERTAERGLPVLIAGEDIGRHLSRLLKRSERPARELSPAEEAWVVLVG